MTLGFAVVLIYLVLAAQFQSFRDPLIVLLGSVPLAISGALVFSFLDLTTINIYSQVGLITLVGLIAKNGILIVEFANTLQARGLSKTAALREAAMTRLRPVLMTSAATVFGHLPLVLVSGPGGGGTASAWCWSQGMTVGTCSRCLWCRCSIIDRDAASAGGGTGRSRGAGLATRRCEGVNGTTMLKITSEQSGDSARLTLEGSLSGPG